ncbi:MAG: biopolymer transporter ExbD [Phycisphaerales bacterium]|nr:biopolymer transporter ExbD [Phycisphaerales bacterium]
MSRLHRHQIPTLQTNLTPLIDLSFLLVIFFVLVARVGEVNTAGIQLPSTVNGASIPDEAPTPLVLNLMAPTADTGAVIVLNDSRYSLTAASIQSLTDELTAALAARPMAEINIRADRRSTYGDVRPVIEAAVRAAELAHLPAARIRLVATRAQAGSV